VAEVGVWCGDFSEEMLSRIPDATVWSVDPWKNLDGNIMWRVMRKALVRLGKYGSRSCVIVAPSPQAAQCFADGFFDFVYLDGDHRYEAVVADLQVWYPKVAPGGILAGDDWGEWLDGKPAVNRRQLTHKNRDGGIRGVMRAVREFAQETGLEIHHTTAESRHVCRQWICFL